MIYHNHYLHAYHKKAGIHFFFTESLPLAKKNFSGLLKICKHVRSHITLMKVLKPFKKFPLIKSRTSFIYLFDYICRYLSSKEKLAILTYHYNFLQKTFSSSSLKKIFGDGIECWSEAIAGEKYSIKMKHSGYLEFEGSNF